MAGGGVQTEKVPRYTREQNQLMSSYIGDVNAFRNRLIQSGTTQPAIELRDWYNRLPQMTEESRSWFKTPQLLQTYQPQVEQMFGAEAVVPARERFIKSYLPQWEQYIKPQVEGAFAGPGYYGSARAEAIRRSLGDLQQQAFETVDVPYQQARINTLANLTAQQAGAETQATAEGNKLYSMLQTLFPQFKQEQLGFESTIVSPLANPIYSNLVNQVMSFDPYYVVGGASGGGGASQYAGAAGQIISTAILVAMASGCSKDIKENIIPLSKEDIINGLYNTKLYRYKYINDSDIQLGVIAEEVPEIFTTHDGKGISIMSMLAGMLACIQDLKQEVDRLKKLTEDK